MLDHPVATREDWLAARKALLEEEKEFTRAPRCAERQTPCAALGQDRQALPFRGVRGRADLERPLRLAPPTHRPAFHVRSRVGEALQELLVLGRRLQRNRRPSRTARHRLRRGFARAAREARGAQAQDGLDLPLGVVGGGRLQLRFRRLVPRRGPRLGRGDLQLCREAGADEGPAGDQRLRQERTAPSITPIRASRAGSI